MVLKRVGEYCKEMKMEIEVLVVDCKICSDVDDR